MMSGYRSIENEGALTTGELKKEIPQEFDNDEILSANKWERSHSVPYE